METVTSPTLPEQHLAPAQPAPTVTLAPESNRTPYVLGALLLILITALYFGYPYIKNLYGQGVPGSLTTSQSSPTPQSQATPAYVPIANTQNKLVYLRSQSNETQNIYEAWLIDPATGKEEQLPIKDFTQAYKHYGSTKLLYRPIGEEAEYRVLDLETGSEVSHKLINHPDPTAYESANMDNIRMISPDMKHLVYNVDFFKPCPSPLPLPPGFEGGLGSCQPDESLDFPYGYYLYDLEKRESTYLGDLVRVSRWDTANHKLYYIKDGGTKVLDLQTKSITTIDASSYFGYFTYPLLKSNQLVSKEGATGNTTGEAAFGKVSLIDIETKKSTEIDRADDWAIIQPFLDASPDDQNIIYVRTNLVGSGIRRFDLYKYNLSEGKAVRLTPQDDKVSYRYYGDWIDNHTFVTTADTIEETGYTNTNNYMIKIDITTGKITRLTAHEKVHSFNTQ